MTGGAGISYELVDFLFRPFLEMFKSLIDCEISVQVPRKKNAGPSIPVTRAFCEGQ
jgi:hypothetical protein